MYPKNADSPPRIAVGSIYLIADGSKVVADASVVVRAEGGDEAGGGGTLVVGATSGIWYYTPAKAETNYTAFTVTVYKADYTTATVTVVTTESAVAGRVSLGSLNGVAARVTDLAEIAEFLIATSCTLTDKVADGSILAHTLVSGGNMSAYDSTTDSQEAVGTVVAAIPTTAMRGTDNALLASTWNTLMAGITSLAEWLGLLAGKQAADATALTEIKATGAGSGTYSETTDSLEALRDRGDAAWTTTDPGLGAHTVTVTVNDGAGNDLESASVRYTKGALTYVLATDSSGNATFNLDSGEWTVAISLAGYTYSGTTHTFSADDTATYSMTAISITAPSDVSLCTVQFQVKLGNTAVKGATCKAKLLGTNVAADGVVLSNAEHSATTDSDGYAELELVRSDQIVKGNKLYGFWVTYNGTSIAAKQCEIPAQATAYFEDLL